MTGGVPDSGGGLGRASSSDGDGEGGSWQEDPPTLDKSYDSLSGGREGRREPCQPAAWEFARSMSVIF